MVPAARSFLKSSFAPSDCNFCQFATGSTPPTFDHARYVPASSPAVQELTNGDWIRIPSCSKRSKGGTRPLNIFVCLRSARTSSHRRFAVDDQFHGVCAQ